MPRLSAVPSMILLLDYIHTYQSVMSDQNRSFERSGQEQHGQEAHSADVGVMRSRQGFECVS